MMAYELWDLETRNRVAVFGSREEALAAVRHTLRTQVRPLAETLMLGTENGDGDGEVITRGAALVALAQAEVPGTVRLAGD